jgi:uncharacterized protein YcaQ
VTESHHLSREDARRIAVRAQLLDAPGPTDLMATIRGLTMLQHDPVSAVAPSAHLVLWSRLGSSYATEELEDAVAEQRVIELLGCYRPAEDISLYRAEMEAWPGVGDEVAGWKVAQDQWVRDNDACRLDILERLRADGPLPLKQLPDTTVRPWRSSGWNNNKNVPMLLDCLVLRGEVAVAGREGRVKLYDLASRVYPDDPFPDVAQAARLRNERRLCSLGIARATGTVMPGEPQTVGDAGEPATVEGVPGEWRVEPGQLDRPFAGRAALLSPLDRLVMDRKRMAELFDFDYTLEMYKPARERRWGYYALPILYGDQLVGKLDATADRKAGELRVHAVHEDHVWSDEARAAVGSEVDDLARWLDLDLVRHHGRDSRTR